MSAVTPEGNSTPISTPRMAILFMVMLVTAAGNTAVQSLLPATGAKLGVPDILVSIGISWSAVLWVYSAPRWAAQSHKRGRRALMKIGVWGFIVAMSTSGAVLLMGLSGWISGLAAFGLFLIFRSIYGYFGAAAPPAVQAYVAARTPREDRTAKLALLASSFGLGTVMGPAAAPYLIVPGLGAPSAFIAFAALALLVVAALQFGLPDDTPRFAARGRATAEPLSSLGGASMLTGDDGEADDANIPGGAKLGWTDPRVRNWFIAGILGSHGQALIMGVLGFLILDRLNLRATPDLAYEPTGLVLTIGAMATLLAQWGLIPMLHLGPRNSVMWGGVLGALGLVLMSQASSLHAIAMAFGIASMGFGLFRPGFTAGASLAVSRHEQDVVAGKVAALNGAAWVLGPAVGVALYGWHESLFFALAIFMCMAMLVHGLRALPKGIANAPSGDKQA